jgi:hypothetical protein
MVNEGYVHEDYGKPPPKRRKPKTVRFVGDATQGTILDVDGKALRLGFFIGNTAFCYPREDVSLASNLENCVKLSEETPAKVWKDPE